MIAASLDALQQASGAQLLNANYLQGKNLSIKGAAIDSRKISAGNIFFALAGTRSNGHDFVAQAAQNGAAVAVVTCRVKSDIAQLVVKDVTTALGQIARWWRDQLKAQVICISGTNGKTTVKEMLAAILAHKHRVSATAANYNNHLGMPLSLLAAKTTDDFVVLELGASNFGELAMLVKIAKPNLVLVNNAARAHLAGFGDIQGVARAKGELYQYAPATASAVINADDNFSAYWQGLLCGQSVFSFSMRRQTLPQDTANQPVVNQPIASQLAAKNNAQPLSIGGWYKPKQHSLQIEAPGQRIDIKLQVLGKHNAQNALASAACAIAVGENLSTIKTALEAFKPVKGRLQTVFSNQNLQLIDDSYNANPDSLLAAAKVLVKMAPQKQTVLLIGELAELGQKRRQILQDLGQKLAVYTQKNQLTAVYVLGESMAELAQTIGNKAQLFSAANELVAHLATWLENNSKRQTVLLFKGSRVAKMEQLLEQIHQLAKVAQC